MKIVNLDQRSPDWLLWRNQGIGSSDAGVLWFGKLFRRTVQDLWKEKCGQKQRNKKPTAAMQRGIDAEVPLRAWYSLVTGHEALPLCCIHEQYPFIKASLDGWVENNQIVVEYKSPNPEDHATALEGKVPEKYLPQLDHLLMVSGGKVAHYVSENLRFLGADQRTIVKYHPDPERMSLLLDLEVHFWNLVETQQLPEDWPVSQPI